MSNMKQLQAPIFFPYSALRVKISTGCVWRHMVGKQEVQGRLCFQGVYMTIVG